ncbi:MAG: SdiA-regulated domain-containing protein [Bacteroidetes bacterium]|nr:SdiA-regulated domain-containing protein [Bacteroidota bacterium]MBS1931588.1 SdiA-regulated domain-containing protein [Bacteroidota bacterium]
MINVNKIIRRRILSLQNPWWTFRLLAAIILLSACKRKMVVLKSPPNYNFANPEIMKLDNRLKEISGISWDKKRDVFFAEVNNTGKIFMLERDTKHIINEASFGEKGDYTDVAMVDSIPYILRNDGVLFKCVTNNSGDWALVELAKLPNEENGFETLFYDVSRKALIIIGNANAKEDEDNINAYVYYIDSIGLNRTPLFYINKRKIRQLSPRKSSELEPTAAAINPVQQKIYILSSSSRQLVITDMNGKPEGVYVLIPGMFPDPTGICFQKNGDMYICNKGGSTAPIMLKFVYANRNDKNVSAPKPMYDFSKPDEIMTLGNHLHEISGISYIAGQDILLAENDEKGEIFKVDFKNKKDDFDKLKFGGHGDYEDIVHTDTADYLLISSGTIVQVLTKNGGITGTREFALQLKGKNEFETLYLDSSGHNLMMLCKQCTHEKDKVRSAYRFDLATLQFSNEPVYDVNLDIIRMRLNDPAAAFKPSAAAINPVTGKLFIVASVGKLLVIADKNGNVENVFRLDPKLFNQPEGITFAPNGDMYISNESGDGAATILKFIYKP